MIIKVYTTITCPYCILVKKFLKDRNIEFEEIDGDDSLESTITVMKQAGSEELPIIQYDEDNFIIGYDEDNLNKLAKLCDRSIIIE